MSLKIESIRAMKNDELHNELDRLRRSLFDLRAQAVTEKLADPMQLGKSKKVIARIKTVLRERGVKDVEQQQARLVALAARTRR
jgi:large subunit ribosomal protein L29